MEQSRWRSPVAWSAVVALILFILKTYGLLSFIGLTEDSFKELTVLLFSALTAFGLFNNPTQADKF
jgi:uncharacterized membrane protein